RQTGFNATASTLRSGRAWRSLLSSPEINLMSAVELASTFVRLGQLVERLQTLRGGSLDAFQAAVAQLLAELERAKFATSKAAAGVLNAPLPNEGGFIPASLSGQLGSVLTTVTAALLAE